MTGTPYRTSTWPSWVPVATACTGVGSVVGLLVLPIIGIVLALAALGVGIAGVRTQGVGRERSLYWLGIWSSLLTLAAVALLAVLLYGAATSSVPGQLQPAAPPPG